MGRMISGQSPRPERAVGMEYTIPGVNKDRSSLNVGTPYGVVGKSDIACNVNQTRLHSAKMVAG
jgi:hypothetical protein